MCSPHRGPGVAQLRLLLQKGEVVWPLLALQNENRVLDITRCLWYLLFSGLAALVLSCTSALPHQDPWDWPERALLSPQGPDGVEWREGGGRDSDGLGAGKGKLASTHLLCCLLSLSQCIPWEGHSVCPEKIIIPEKLHNAVRLHQPSLLQ